MKKYFTILLLLVGGAANASDNFSMQKIYEGLNLHETVVGHAATGQPVAFEKSVGGFTFSCRKILKDNGNESNYMCRFDFERMALQENLKKIYDVLPASPNAPGTHGAGGFSCSEQLVYSNVKQANILKYSCLLNSWD